MPSRAVAEASKEAQLKAAFVFNFIRYTEWPAAAFDSPESSVRLCAFSLHSDTGLALSALATNRVGERSLQVSVVRTGEEMARCHLVYFESGVATSLIPRASQGGMPVLTVGESMAFAKAGGVIGLVSKGARLGFEVNLDAAKRAQLRLSSQLLALAQIVKED